MPLDMYSTDVLMAVLEDLQQPRSFLLDLFFGGLIEDPSEEIHFDIDKSKPRITPLVSPLVAGKVVEDRGFTTGTFKPAYAKDKRRLLPNQPLKRRIGEKIGGTLAPMERRQLQLRDSMDDQLKMLTRREEVWAALALRAGQYTVSGEGYPDTNINFQRDASLTITLAGAAKWDQAGVDVLGNLETWAGMMQALCGAVSTTIVSSPDTWTKARLRLAESDIGKMVLNSLRGGSGRAEMGPSAPTKQLANKVAEFGSFEWWTYDDVYIDEAGATQHLMPSGTLVMAGADVEGSRCYAAIQDEEAEYQATRYFTKSWLQKDPAVRWLLLQSAPLVVPFRPNASLCVKVF